MVARRVRGQGGFTYVGLVVFVAILGMVGAATLKVDALLRRAAAERELLEIGAAYSEALRSYAAATPRGQPPWPPSLRELLRDPRFPGTRRHLRKIFVDPVTGGTEWGVVYQADKAGVLALYSLSQARPLKLANFDARFRGFENKEHLSEWRFMAGQAPEPAPVPAPPMPVPAPGTPALPPAAPAQPLPPPDPQAEPAPEDEPEPEPEPEPEAPPEAPPTTAATVSGR